MSKKLTKHNVKRLEAICKAADHDSNPYMTISCYLQNLNCTNNGKEVGAALISASFRPVIVITNVKGEKFTHPIPYKGM